MTDTDTSKKFSKTALDELPANGLPGPGQYSPVRSTVSLQFSMRGRTKSPTSQLEQFQSPSPVNYQQASAFDKTKAQSIAPRFPPLKLSNESCPAPTAYQQPHRSDSPEFTIAPRYQLQDVIKKYPTPAPISYTPSKQSKQLSFSFPKNKTEPSLPKSPGPAEYDRPIVDPPVQFSMSFRQPDKTDKDIFARKVGPASFQISRADNVEGGTIGNRYNRHVLQFNE